MDRIVLSIDGNAACALLGQNIQEGECEFEPITGNLPRRARAAASRAYERLVARIGARLPYRLGSGLES